MLLPQSCLTIIQLLINVLSLEIIIKGLIRRLQAYDSCFNLYEHKSVAGKWILSHSKAGEIENSYPIKAPGGQEKTYIDISRLKVIERRFKIPREVFTSTEKEIKRKFNSSDS
ncbi:MAG: hypothetical protein OXC62_14895 [Aestuariivita sp.]|nr:hypothetical protein [Aestuariivita sp.]